jgi:hypothetical protein
MSLWFGHSQNPRTFRFSCTVSSGLHTQEHAHTSITTATLIIIQINFTKKMSSQLELFDCGGCGVPYTLQDISLHIAACEQYPIHCPSCRKGMKRNQLYEHNNVCEKRILKCTLCHTQLFANTTADHDSKCLEWVNKRKFEEEIKVYMKELFTEAITEANTVNHKKFKEMLGEAINEINNSNKRQKVAVAEPVAEIDSDSEQSSPDFEVEAILGTSMIKGVKHYQIRWKPIDGVRWGNSWEPRSNLRHCRGLLHAFEAKEAKEEEEDGDEDADESNLKTVEIRDGAGHKSDVSRLLNKWILKQPVEALADRTINDVWDQFVSEMGKEKVKFKFNSDFFRRALRARTAKDPELSQLETPFKPKNGMLLKITTLENPDDNNFIIPDEDEDSSNSEQESAQLSEEEKIVGTMLGNIPQIHVGRALNPYAETCCNMRLD